MVDLYKVLKEVGKTPTDIIRETPLSKSTVYRALSGKGMTPGNLKIFADCCGVNVGYLLGTEEKTAPAMSEHDKSVAMLMDLWSKLTAAERLELVSYAAELERERKGD